MDHRRWKPCFSPMLYRGPNRIKRFFNRIKHFRRLATSYEKHASNFLAMFKLAAANPGCAIVEISDLTGNAVLNLDPVDGRQANGDIESAAGKAMNGLTLAA